MQWKIECQNTSQTWFCLRRTLRRCRWSRLRLNGVSICWRRNSSSTSEDARVKDDSFIADFSSSLKHERPYSCAVESHKKPESCLIFPRSSQRLQSNALQTLQQISPKPVSLKRWHSHTSITLLFTPASHCSDISPRCPRILDWSPWREDIWSKPSTNQLLWP